MLKELRLDCACERSRIVSFIRETMGAAGFSRGVLGLSGGVDSALVATLCVEAMGRDQMLAMILPYRTSNPSSEMDARLLVEHLGIACERFEITAIVQPFIDRYSELGQDAGVRVGNIMARCRMMVLYDASARTNALVMGTSNRTETLLGYFTMHGDGAAALKPIGHLYKCQVRALARHVGVPEPIIAKAPSADLWAGQTDEGELGFTYDEADQILYLLTEARLEPEAIAAKGFPIETVQAVARRMASTAYKRKPVPALPTVASPATA